MKRIKNFVIGGLQQKIFNLVLITMILVVVAFGVVLGYQTKNLRDLVAQTDEKQQEAIEGVITTTMDAVLENSMGKSTLLESYIADNVFAELRGDVMMLEEYAQKLYEKPWLYSSMKVAAPDAADDGTVKAQLLMEDGVRADDPAVWTEAGLIGNMADMMETLFSTTRLNSCFIGTENGLFQIVDDRAGVKFAEDGTLKSFPVRQRPWYVGAKNKEELFFSDVELDAFSGDIGIVCAIPVYVEGELKAVVGADYFLDTMRREVGSSGDEDTGFTCIINQYGHVLFAPDEQDLFVVQDKELAEDLRTSEEQELAQFVTDALSGQTGVRQVQVGDTVYYMAGAPLTTVGWSVVSVVERELTRQPIYQMQEQYDAINREAVTTFRESSARSQVTMFVLLALVLVCGIAAALVLAKRIVMPLNTITSRIAALQGRNLQFMMEDTYRTGDEIEVLAESFATLSEKTVRYMEEIREVTAEKERIGAELGMAKAIQASQLPHLFPAFPDRNEFDIYASMDPAKEVGGDFYDFFLLDHDHIGLVMADVSGKGVPAALFMMVARILLRNRIQSGESPAVALANVNEQLLESDEPQLFVTVWLAILEISTGKGIAANAGHEHPILRRAGGEYELVVYRHSPAVAAMEGIVYREHSFEMHPGDSLFVYTDGVAEATNAEYELFGTKRILKALNRDPEAEPEEVLQNVREEIDAFVAGAEQFDDITMMCLKYNGPQSAAGSKDRAGSETDSGSRN